MQASGTSSQAHKLATPQILLHMYKDVHPLGGLVQSLVQSGGASTSCAPLQSAVSARLTRPLSNSDSRGKRGGLDSARNEVNGCGQQEGAAGRQGSGSGQCGVKQNKPGESAPTCGPRHVLADQVAKTGQSHYLVLESDPDEYKVELLERSFAVLSDRAPRFGRDQSGPDNHGWTQTELVRRVIELHFQKGGRPNDALCQGHQRPNAHTRKQGQPLPSTSGIECLALNSAFATVTSPPWELLLSRIGAPAMLHLLLHASIFTPLPNGCLLQVSGRPITDLVWKKRLQPPLISPKDASTAPNRTRNGRSTERATQSGRSIQEVHVRFKAAGAPIQTRKRRHAERATGGGRLVQPGHVGFAAGKRKRSRHLLCKSKVVREEIQEETRAGCGVSASRKKCKVASGTAAGEKELGGTVPKGMDLPGLVSAKLLGSRRTVRSGSREGRRLCEENWGAYHEQVGIQECAADVCGSSRLQEPSYEAGSDALNFFDGRGSPPISHVSNSCSDDDSMGPLSQGPALTRIRGGAKAPSACHVAGTGSGTDRKERCGPGRDKGGRTSEVERELGENSAGLQGSDCEDGDTMCTQPLAARVNGLRGEAGPADCRERSACVQGSLALEGTETEGRGEERGELGWGGGTIGLEMDPGPLSQEDDAPSLEESESAGTLDREKGKRKRVRPSSWQRKRQRQSPMRADSGQGAGNALGPELLVDLGSEEKELEFSVGLDAEEPLTQDASLGVPREKRYRVVIRGKGASVAVSRRNASRLQGTEAPNGQVRPNVRCREAPPRNVCETDCPPTSRPCTGQPRSSARMVEEGDPSRHDRGLAEAEGIPSGTRSVGGGFEVGPVPSVARPGMATKKGSLPAKGSPKGGAGAGSAKNGPWLLPRAAMFYNASHGRKAGLRTSHILRSLGTDASAAKALLWHVFESATIPPPVAKPQQTTSFQAAFGSLLLDKKTEDSGRQKVKERRVPKQLRAVLPLFQDLLVGVNTLDFGRLLARHCPLPATLKRKASRTEPSSARSKQAAKEKRCEKEREHEVHDQRSELRMSLELGLQSHWGPSVGGSAAGLVQGGPVHRNSESVEEGYCADQLRVQGLVGESDGYVTQEEEEDFGSGARNTASKLAWASLQNGSLFIQKNGREEAAAGFEGENQPKEQKQLHVGGGDAAENPASSPASQPSSGGSEGLAALLPAHFAPELEATYKELIGQFCEHRQVAAFVWSALCKVVRGPLLGGACGSASARALRERVNRFVRLGRFETMSMEELMHGLRLEDFSWLWDESPRSRGAVLAEEPGGDENPCSRGAFLADILGRSGSAKQGVQQGVVLAMPERRVAGVVRVDQFFKENAIFEDHYEEGFWDEPCDVIPLTQEPMTAKTEFENRALPQTNPNRTTPPFLKRMPKFPPDKTAQLRRRLSDWLYFLFSKLVIPLLRTHFYITESEPHKQKVFYYRKPAWRQLAAISVRQLAGPNGPYRQVAAGEAEALLARAGRSFGPAELRLLPKASGMRPIARLGVKSVVQIERRMEKKAAEVPRARFRRRSSTGNRNLNPSSTGVEEFEDGLVGRGGFEKGTRQPDWIADALGRTPERKHGSGIKGAAAIGAGIAHRNTVPGSRVLEFGAPNKLLGDAHAILKFEKWRGSEHLGCSVFGFDDIHAKLRAFLRALRGKLGGAMPRVYMAGCDIAAAYDTIPQDFLWQILQPLFRSPVYQLLWNSRATPAFGTVRVRGEKVATSVDVSCDHVPLRAFREVVQRLTSQKSGGAVFVDQVNCSEIARGKQLFLVREHLFSSLVRYGRAYLHQRLGIAQGSILSTLFCSFFYAHLERNELLPFLERKAREEALLEGARLAKGRADEGMVGAHRAFGEERGSPGEDGNSELADKRRGEKLDERRTANRGLAESEEGEGDHETLPFRGVNGFESQEGVNAIAEESLDLGTVRRSAFTPGEDVGLAVVQGGGVNDRMEEFTPSPSLPPNAGVNEPVQPRTPEHSGKEAWLRLESSGASSEGSASDGEEADSRASFGENPLYDLDQGFRNWSSPHMSDFEQGYASQDERLFGEGEAGEKASEAVGDLAPRERSAGRLAVGGMHKGTTGANKKALNGTGEENSVETAIENLQNELEPETDAYGTYAKAGEKAGEFREDLPQSMTANQEEPRGSGHVPESLLMRWVDDSLFLSTSKRHVAAYVGAMHAGFPAYGAEANPAKTCLNFELEGERERVLPPNMYVDGRGRSFIRWCGLLLNSESLEVQADYTRYSGEFVRDSMAVDVTKGHRGRILADRLCLWLRPKCHAVFFDTAINLPTTVRLNIYQAFLLCAIKFHCFLTAAGGDVSSNPRFLAREIRKAIGYMCAAVRNAKEAACRRGMGSSGKVSKSQVLWLGLYAFQRVLGRKQARYKPLLELLKQDFGREAKQLSRTLSPAVAEDLSTLFNQILY